MGEDLCLLGGSCSERFANHLVAVRVGEDRILCCEGDAAGGDHQEDAHLKVAQVDDVVASPPHPAGRQPASQTVRPCHCP